MAEFWLETWLETQNTIERLETERYDRRRRDRGEKLGIEGPSTRSLHVSGTERTTCFDENGKRTLYKTKNRQVPTEEGKGPVVYRFS